MDCKLCMRVRWMLMNCKEGLFMAASICTNYSIIQVDVMHSNAFAWCLFNNCHCVSIEHVGFWQPCDLGCTRLIEHMQKGWCIVSMCNMYLAATSQVHAIFAYCVNAVNMWHSCSHVFHLIFRCFAKLFEFVCWLLCNLCVCVASYNPAFEEIHRISRYY